MLTCMPGVRGLVIRLQSQLARLTRGFQFGEGLRVFGRPILRCVKGGQVVVGRRFVMISNSAFSALAVSHPCFINVFKPGAKIAIGDDVGINGAAIACETAVTIGDRVMIGVDAIITDTDFHPWHEIPRRYVREGAPTAPVEIGDDAFIGMRAMVLKGSRIGKGAVIGAGAVVTGEIPPYAIAAGQPAHVIGTVPHAGE